MKDFVNYNQALELKELGFDEPCFGYYDLDGLQVKTHHWYPQNKNSSFPLPHTTNNPKISAPTFSQAFRFFREKGYMFNIVNDVSASKDGCYYFDLWLSGQILWETDYIYKTYEEAESACLDKLIELAKTK